MRKKALGAVLFICVILAGSLSAQYSVLHHFAGGTADGGRPEGSLVIGGTTLYGVTIRGGSFDVGTVFKINLDGTGLVLLHSFAGGAADGQTPAKTLILKGKTLFGTTYGGGPADQGTIFKINTDGTGYAVLHFFSGGAADGVNPTGALVARGRYLYGMSTWGGVSDTGTIYKIKTNGTGFAVLHSFAGGTADGARPQQGALVFKGSKLYGLTWGGGAYSCGVIFRINASGTGFVLLHSFAGGDDGVYPFGSVFIKAGALYGMTYGGGANDRGVVFKMNINGSGYSVLHSFSEAASDGYRPFGSPFVKGAVLYGLTSLGGANDLGALFRINLKDASFEVLHSFAGGAGDGSWPLDSVIWKKGILYGMAYRGGAANDGIVFSYSTK